jgi:hypothetical protein
MGRLSAAQIDCAYEQSNDSTVLAAAERKIIETDLRIWDFGKWALMGDGSSQHIRRQLQHRSSRGTPTFWETIMPMNDEEGVAFDRWLSRALGEMERKAILCAYQYHCSEDSGARTLRLTRKGFRTIRDAALKKLRDAEETA